MTMRRDAQGRLIGTVDDIFEIIRRSIEKQTPEKKEQFRRAQNDAAWDHEHFIERSYCEHCGRMIRSDEDRVSIGGYVFRRECVLKELRGPYRTMKNLSPADKRFLESIGIVSDMLREEED
jgi:hypothetical protein